MPQISLYIDKKTLDKVEQMAMRSNMSISKWVANNIRRLINDDFPADYFSLFGALDDVSFKRPQQPHPGYDVKRESI